MGPPRRIDPTRAIRVLAANYSAADLKCAIYIRNLANVALDDIPLPPPPPPMDFMNPPLLIIEIPALLVHPERDVAPR